VNGLRAELRKLRTVRTTWILTLFGWGLVVLSTGTVLFSTLVGDPFTGTDQQIASAVDQIGGTAMIVLIVALLAMTTEFRHGTIGRTLQIVPSRTRVLVAKLLAGVVYSLLYFVSSLAIVGLLLAISALAGDAELSTGGQTATALWHGPVGLMLNAILGVTIGALIRSQVVGLTVTLVWLFLVENLVLGLWPSIGRWLPFQALNSLFIPADAASGAGFTLLDPPVALATFLAYVVAVSALAVALLRTRDV
jgi:ABC-2 type transport system permease protein